MAQRSQGRMICQHISLSSKVASLSPESLSLFCLLIPHLNSYGKMLANPHSIKGGVCPLIEWLPLKKIEECLLEISENTNVKWWQDDKKTYYLQSLSWTDHQTLRGDRLGVDRLPDWPNKDQDCAARQEHSRTTPVPRPREVEVEVKVKSKVKNKGGTALNPLHGETPCVQNDTDSDIEKLTNAEIKDAFDKLWNDFPKKEGRKDAIRHFKASVKNIYDVQRITKALENYKAVLQAEPNRSIKNGSTWFNNWQDYEDSEVVTDAIANTQRVNGTATQPQPIRAITPEKQAHKDRYKYADQQIQEGLL